MDFVGLAIADDPGCGLIKVLGCDRMKNGKVVPTYFTENNKNRIFTIVRTQDEFINYRSRREELEYFNPFVKAKNALLLMLMTTQVIYSNIKEEKEDNEQFTDIIDSIVEDEMMVSQEDVLSKVRIKQYPSEKDDDTGEMTYIYKVEMTEGDTILEIESRAKTKILAMLMLIIKVMGHFEEPPMILDNFGGSYDDLMEYLSELLVKYDKERTLNSKDIKKINIETTVELYDSDDLELLENSDDMGLMLNESTEQTEDKPNEKEAVIDISDIHRDTLPMYYSLDDDDDMVDLDLFG